MKVIKKQSLYSTKKKRSLICQQTIQETVQDHKEGREQKHLRKNVVKNVNNLNKSRTKHFKQTTKKSDFEETLCGTFILKYRKYLKIIQKTPKKTTQEDKELIQKQTNKLEVASCKERRQKRLIQN